MAPQHGQPSHPRFTATITLWNTTLQGNSMGGNVNDDLTLTGVPGVAGIQSRLNSVTRQ